VHEAAVAQAAVAVCLDPDCANGSWTEEDDRIGAPPRHDRPSRTIDHRTVPRVRSQRERGGKALGLDEALRVRRSRWRRQELSTQIVDVGHGQLLDVVPGRSGTEPVAWLAARGKTW